MPLSVSIANRFGFIALGITNNFVYIIMLAAAYDLLNQSSPAENLGPIASDQQQLNASSFVVSPEADNDDDQIEIKEPYCNKHSTAIILLADTVPALVIKIIYPFLFVSMPANLRAIMTALLATAALLFTGLSSNQVLIFSGVICASLSQGFGECVYLGSTPHYGDVSLSGWCMGSGLAGLLSSTSYALLRMILPIKQIMLLMLVVPVVMMVAYFKIIKPVHGPSAKICCNPTATTTTTINISATIKQQPNYMTATTTTTTPSIESWPTVVVAPSPVPQPVMFKFNFMDRVRYLPQLRKYFLPILLVYFAEYFINQGLFQLIYYPEVTYLDHAAQYRWFTVSYQLGVMISRSSLDFIKINNIWAMSILQFANTLLFAAHASKLIHLPSFYLVVAVIVYEGLLGGLTFVNGFYRVKKETEPEWQEFSLCTVTIAEHLGIVSAGLSAIPVHEALCKLYD